MKEELLKVISDNGFKRISDILELFWGHHEFYIYIEKLFINDRDSKRQGFPPDVFMALSKLNALHTETFQNIQSLKWSNLDHYGD